MSVDHLDLFWENEDLDATATLLTGRASGRSLLTPPAGRVSLYGSSLTGGAAGKRMITDIFNLSEVNGGVKTDDGKYLVTLEVTSVTSSMTGIQILYYNTVTGEWVIITPSDIDYANQTVIFVIDQLPAPVCVIADTGTSAEDSAEGLSPQTGVVSGWPLWMGAAVILAGVSLAAYRKSKNE